MPNNADSYILVPGLWGITTNYICAYACAYLQTEINKKSEKIASNNEIGWFDRVFLIILIQ